MIWLKKIGIKFGGIYLWALLFSCIFGLFLNTYSASAVDMWSTGYWQDNCNQSWGFHLFSYLGRYDLPRDAIPYCVGGAGTLEGVRVEQFGSFGDSSKKFNQLTISLTLYQSLNYQGVNTIRTDVPANGYLITTDDIMYKGGCNTHRDREKTVWTCVVNAPDYKSFGYIGIDIGSLYDSSDIPIAYYGYDVGFTGSLQYYSLSYNVSSSSDPAVSGINQLVDQNNRMIDQNNRMIDQNGEMIELLNNQAEKEQEQEQEIENKTVENEEQAEELANESNTKFSSLFQIFTSFVASLHTVSVSNCLINLPDLYSLHFGELDFCQFPLPSQFGILGSVLCIGLFVPLSFIEGKRFVNTLMEWFK